MSTRNISYISFSIKSYLFEINDFEFVKRASCKESQTETIQFKISTNILKIFE